MHTNTQKAIQTYHLHITCRDPQAGAQFLELQFQDTGRSKPPAGAIKQIKESCQAETHAQNNMQSVHWTYIAFLFQTTSHIVANIPRSQEDLKPIISLQSTSELNINPLCRIPRKHRWALASDCVQKTIEVHAAWILLQKKFNISWNQLDLQGAHSTWNWRISIPSRLQTHQLTNAAALSWNECSQFDSHGTRIKQHIWIDLACQDAALPFSFAISSEKPSAKYSLRALW